MWEHKTASSHGAARLAVHHKIYELLLKYVEEKEGADLVFTTTNGEKVTHYTVELDKLAETFGKKFSVTPTLNRKQMATVIGQRVMSGMLHLTCAIPWKYTGPPTSIKAGLKKLFQGL